MSSKTALAAMLVVAALASGCAGGSERAQRDAGRDRAAPGGDAGTAERRLVKPARRRVPRCPQAADNCRRAGGRVMYVERVDPDGGGDVHLVLATREGVTAPGLTVVDIEPRERPARLPRTGDWVGASGPVYRGSHGQRQIEATKLRVSRAGR